MNDHQLLRYSRHILLDEIGTTTTSTKPTSSAKPPTAKPTSAASKPKPWQAT